MDLFPSQCFQHFHQVVWMSDLQMFFVFFFPPHLSPSLLSPFRRKAISICFICHWMRHTLHWIPHFSSPQQVTELFCQGSLCRNESICLPARQGTAFQVHLSVLAYQGCEMIAISFPLLGGNKQYRRQGARLLITRLWGGRAGTGTPAFFRWVKVSCTSLSKPGRTWLWHEHSVSFGESPCLKKVRAARSKPVWEHAERLGAAHAHNHTR